MWMIFLFCSVCFDIVVCFRLSKEDHSAREIIQINKSRRHYDWRGIDSFYKYLLLAFWGLSWLDRLNWWLQNKLITVTPETKVLRAMQLMTGKLIFFFHKDCNFFRVLKYQFNVTDNRIRHIPVIKDKGMVGMVSIGDVVRAVVTEHREELNRLNAFIQGGY